MKSPLLLSVLVLLTSGLISVADAQTVNSQDRDIGAVGAAGSASNNGSGGFTVTGSGADIWGTADEFHYVYFQVNGDFEISGRVTGIDFTDGWAKGGLMARESLDANSRNIMVFAIPQNYDGLQWRAVTGGSSAYTPGEAISFPHWLKLVRSGNTFSGYRSADGNNWTLIGSTTIALPSSLYVGLAVTSHHDGTLCTAHFDNVTENSSGGGGGTSGVPAAPTGLTATPYSSTEVLLSWTDNANDEIYFRVERSTDGVNFQVLNPRPPNGATNMYDFPLSPSTHYWYRIYAVNNAGDSRPSNVAEVTTPSSGGGSTSGWHDQDIGNVSAAGSFSQSGNSFTVGGSGADIWGTADEFHYAYQIGANVQYTSVQIVARVSGMANTSPWAKTGVMIRDSVSPSAANVLLALTPEHGLAFQWRSVEGGQSSYIDAGAASAPVWVKLVKTADTITGYRSADGANWTQVGSVTATMPNSDSGILMGMAVTSHNDGTVCIANFDNVTLTGSTGGGGGGAAPAAPSNLTATPGSSAIQLAWSDNSTNETGFVVQRSTDGTTFAQIAVVPEQTASMSDSAITAGTHYWYRVAATNSFGTSPWSNVAQATAPTSGGGGGGVPAAPSGLTATPQSSTRINLAWQDNSTNETGFVLERSVSGSDPSQFARIGVYPANTRTAVDAINQGGGHYWYRVAATNNAGLSPYSNIAETSPPVNDLPAPWQNVQVGGGSANGATASYSNGVFYVPGGGSDIYGTSDSFYIVYQPISGDQTITAAIEGIDPLAGSVDPWARVGLMIRETLADASKNAMVFLSAQHGTGFTWRDTTAGSTQYTPGPQSARFLRLTRTGNTFSAYSSADGNSWQLMASVTIDMASSAYVGLAVTSHGYPNEVQGRFSNVTVTGGSGGGGGGSGGTLPSGWADQDVGAVNLAGSASYNQGTFTVKGDGADIWGSADAFHYVYFDIGGNGELVARVTAIQNTEPWAKAGLMFRQSTLADSANALVMVTAGQGTGLQARSVDGGGSSYVPGPFYSAPVWLKLKKQATTLTGFTSLDGSNWTTIGSYDLPQSNPTGFPPLFLIGLAVTSHSNAALNTSTFDNVTWTPMP